jgi:hypothetical protein
VPATWMVPSSAMENGSELEVMLEMIAVLEVRERDSAGAGCVTNVGP